MGHSDAQHELPGEGSGNDPGWFIWVRTLDFASGHPQKRKETSAKKHNTNPHPKIYTSVQEKQQEHIIPHLGEGVLPGGDGGLPIGQRVHAPVQRQRVAHFLGHHPESDRCPARQGNPQWANQKGSWLEGTSEIEVLFLWFLKSKNGDLEKHAHFWGQQVQPGLVLAGFP